MRGSDHGRHYKAVTLDLFGTLLDFRTVFNTTLQRILIDHDLVEKAQVFRDKWQEFTFKGLQGSEFITVQEDFKVSLVWVLRELRVEGDLRNYADGVLDGMFNTLRTADLFPEVPEVLSSLDSAGVPWGIISNVDEDDLNAVVAHHGLRPSVTVSSERVVSYKPEPIIFETALREMGGLEPGQVLHSGDTPVADVAGASAAGLDVAWLNRYMVSYPEDLPQPTFELPDLSPLTRLVLEGKS
ncbi:MAG: HAD-IA family hydrolase [Thermoplasmata archaeon]|nr:HAD-IA family hydrolase [Thermoplasmata archaeon]